MDGRDMGEGLVRAFKVLCWGCLLLGLALGALVGFVIHLIWG